VEGQARFVDNILDIKPFEETVIIGTLFKEQKLKPSILNNIMGVLGQKKYMEGGQFAHGQYVNHEEDDVAVLEDISGRITIQNSPKFQINHFVSGSILALKGRAVNGGYFEVNDYCFAGVPFRDCPATVKISQQPTAKRDLYDPALLNSNRQFIALASGLQVGRGATHLRHQLLAQFLRGEFADIANQKLASQITRLVLAGDSMVQPSKVDDVLRGSYRTAKLNEEVYRGIDEVLGLLEQWLDQVSETMDVDLMPGEMDFSNAFVPQQPFNSCLFP
jgi:DNA polymerase delta subunit 2